MDLTFVDKLASQNNGVNTCQTMESKYSCCRQFFDICRNINNKNKARQRHFTSFQEIDFSKNTPETLWVDKGTEYGETFFKILQGERH